MNTEVKQRKVANQRRRASRPNESTHPEEVLKDYFQGSNFGWC